MYGSASGFLTRACIATPTTASPPPTKNASNPRGIRRSHTMRCIVDASPRPDARIETTSRTVMSAVPMSSEAATTITARHIEPTATRRFLLIEVACLFEYVMNCFDTIYQPWTWPVQQTRINGEDVLIGYS